MNPATEAREILRILTIQWVRGLQAYFVAKQVHESREKKRIASLVYFFNTVELSCQETTILALSKLLVTNKDSITIPYLLDYAGRNPLAFPKANDQLLPEVISRHREQLNELEPLINRIKKQRDKTIAHLDKLHVSNPSTIANTFFIDFLQVEKIFKDLQQLINEYGEYLEPPFSFLQDIPKPSVIEDVEYLTQLIEQDDLKEE